MVKRKDCFQCGASFVVRREWQLFCSRRCRLRHHREDGGYCFFCGDIGPSDRHHLEPAAMRAAGRYAGQETVLVCRVCNGVLGDRRWADIEDQFLCLIGHYEGKLGRSRPDWSDVEVDELGPGLRRRIRRMLAEERRLGERLAYLTIRRARIIKRMS